MDTQQIGTEMALTQFNHLNNSNNKIIVQSTDSEVIEIIDEAKKSKEQLSLEDQNISQGEELIINSIKEIKLQNILIHQENKK